jgi:hypothetical protein
MEGTENQNQWSGWSGNLGETVVETNGGGQELVGESDNGTHEGVCWLNDWRKVGENRGQKVLIKEKRNKETNLSDGSRVIQSRPCRSGCFPRQSQYRADHCQRQC